MKQVFMYSYERLSTSVLNEYHINFAFIFSRQEFKQRIEQLDELNVGFGPLIFNFDYSMGIYEV